MQKSNGWIACFWYLWEIKMHSFIFRCNFGPIKRAEDKWVPWTSCTKIANITLSTELWYPLRNIVHLMQWKSARQRQTKEICQPSLFRFALKRACPWGAEHPPVLFSEYVTEFNVSLWQPMHTTSSRGVQGWKGHNTQDKYQDLENLKTKEMKMNIYNFWFVHILNESS